MSLIDCKIELKLKWTKYCVLAVLNNENDNADADSNNNIFTIEDAKLYVPVVALSARDNQFIGRSVYWNEYKTKGENINRTNEYRYFLKSNFVEVNRLLLSVHLNQNDIVKRI